MQRQRTIAACCAEEQPLLRLITARLDGHVQDMMRVSSTWPFGRDQLDCDPWHYLPELVPGRVFMLTSLPTFSTAISSVAYAKQAAPERVAIVGESVGDRMMFFVEGDGIDLPNTRAGCRAP